MRTEQSIGWNQIRTYDLRIVRRGHDHYTSGAFTIQLLLLMFAGDESNPVVRRYGDRFCASEAGGGR